MTVGPIIFGHPTARGQLVEHGEVVTFRTSERTTGSTWWRESRTGPKQGDVQVELIGPADAVEDDLAEYAELSGFESWQAWRDAIVDVHGGETSGYLYWATTDAKEANRLGTINRWDAPEGEWAADYPWTRYRGPPPWPVPGGWVFEDPEGGGWWTYYGELGVGHYDDNKIRDELRDDDSVDNPHDLVEEARGARAYLEVETANPDEVSLRNPEDEKLEWSLKIDDTRVFRRVEPDRPDLMAAVAEALDAYHEDELDERVDAIVPSSGRKPDDVREQETIEEREEQNRALGEYSGSDA